MATTAAATSKKLAVRGRSSVRITAILLLVLIPYHAVCARPQASNWYLLSGTATDHDRHYPSSLYSIDSYGTKKLHLVRQIVSQEDGVHSIHFSDNNIFVLYPHLLPSKVSVIHTDAPRREDLVAFDPGGRVVIDSRLAMAQQKTHVMSELLWLLSPEDQLKGTVLSIAASPSNEGKRILKDAWDDYAFLRFDGTAGGPIAAPDLVGSFRNNSVGIAVSDKYAAVDELPVEIARSVNREIPFYLGVNSEYLVFALRDHADDIQSGALTNKPHQMAYVHDRLNGRWTTVRLDGTCSRTRIFGSWLATIVQFWDPNHPPNPGAMKERSIETATLPNVRLLYSMFAGRDCRIPGLLVLRDLRTGEQITLNTGQEDSEVIGIHGPKILYRIDNKIYQATIEGAALKNSELLVEDEDVPEIHWAFWTD